MTTSTRPARPATGTRPEPTPTTVPAPTMVEVAQGVHAYVQPDGGWCVNNAGLVTADGHGVLIDTAATVRRAEQLRRQVRRRCPAGPEMVINTHHHGDHVFGNGAFPAAVIVGHERTRTEMLESGLGLTILWPDVDWGPIDLVPPVLTYRDSLTVHVGDVELHLMHVGPAHTTNDTAVWVPQQGVLFAGDVLMSGTTPFCLMGSIAGSLHAVRRLRGLGATTIVCGHGPVAGPEVFDANESYLTWLLRTAQTGRAAGLSPLEVARETDLGGFAGWLDAERVVGNLHRAYSELSGAPLGCQIDVAGPFGEMVAYHGALPTCHA